MFHLVKPMFISFGFLFLVSCGGVGVLDIDPNPDVPDPENETNIAIGKSVSQSSSAHGGIANRAIDGNTDGTFGNESVTHTEPGSQPWWQVDLGAVESISTITIYNRTDCCIDRLSDFYLLVSDVVFESNNLQESRSQSEVKSYYFGDTVEGSTSFNVGTSGRYVRVQKVGDTDALSLAEVEVITGIEVDPIDPDPVDPDPVDPDLVALYEFGAEVYGQKCAECHDSLEVSKKRGASRQDIVNSLEIPQMRNIELNDEELDALAYVLNNPHPDDVVVDVPVELTGGALIFAQQCADCHAEGAVTFFPLLDKYTDLDSITQYTEDTMPLNKAGECVGECATLVAEYILTLEFDEEVSVADLGTQRLKRSHYYKTIEYLVGQYGIDVNGLSHPSDPVVEGFAAGSEVDSTLVFSYHQNAGTIAKELVEAIEDDNDLIGCRDLETDCVRQFYLDFAERAYRHPLIQEQTDQLNAVFEAAGPGSLLGIGYVVGYVLQSPYFLYYLDTTEDDYTLANQLAFTLWNEPPDEILLDLAGRGELSSPVEFNRQIDRLLDADKGHQTLLDFASEWLTLERVQQVFKDATAIPDFSADVVAELEQDLLVFVDASMKEEDSFEHLFNGSYALSSNLVSTLSQWNNDVQAERNGVLSQPGLLAFLSGPVERSPILRGSYVMDKLLCDHRPPVEAIDDVVSDIVVPENAGPRERTEILTESPVCQACHASINPLGFGFEDYDGLGLPIGESRLETIQVPATERTDSVSLSFNGVEDLQQAMLGTHQFYDCAVDKMLGYANLIDRPSVASAEEIYGDFRDSANLRALFKAIALTMLENN